MIRKVVFLSIVAITVAAFLLSCEGKKKEEEKAAQGSSVIRHIEDADQFKTVMESSGSRLVIIDFYADWCPPCKELNPILEKIARENDDKATVYKVNVDNNKSLAGAFGVSGIPFVVFIKDKAPVHTLIGLHPRESYVKAIKQFS